MSSASLASFSFSVFFCLARVLSRVICVLSKQNGAKAAAAAATFAESNMNCWLRASAERNSLLLLSLDRFIYLALGSGLSIYLHELCARADNFCLLHTLMMMMPAAEHTHTHTALEAGG